MAERKKAKEPRQAKTTTRATPARGPRRAQASAGKAKASRQSPYDRLFRHLKDDFGAVKDALAGEFDQAIDAARTKLDESGVVDHAKLKRVQEDLRAQLKTARERVTQAKDKVVTASERLQSDERVRHAADAGVSALHSLAHSFRGLAERVEHALEDMKGYAAGDQVPAGSYACTGCGARMQPAAGRLAPCPACAGKSYRRIG